MINTKIYNQRVDFKSMISIYTPFKKSCIKVLKDNYQGRCYKGAYIIDIESILKNSDLEISRNHLDGRGSSFVMFKANVIQRDEGDLVAKCKIIKRKDGRMFAETKYSNVILLNHDLLKIVKEGDIIPIIVKKSRYTPLRNKISVFAVPFVPQISANTYIYVCDGSLTSVEVQKLNTYITQMGEINSLIKKLKPADEKKFSYYNEIFYPFKNVKKPKLLENKNVILLDILTMKFEADKDVSRIIISCDEINKSKSFVLSTTISWLDSVKKSIEKDKSNSKSTILNDKPYVIFESLYIERIKYLLFLKDMVQSYELPKEKNIYWRSLKEYKR